MHTARSRNDQVMVTELLYLRERGLDLATEAARVVERSAGAGARACGHGDARLHAHAAGQADHVRPVGAELRRRPAARPGRARGTSGREYDACPLGAVESYGTSWPIDRALTARLLGFGRVWEVPQDAIASRGLPQLAYLDVCKRLALTMSKIAADLLLFTTWEYGYVQLGRGRRAAPAPNHRQLGHGAEEEPRRAGACCAPPGTRSSGWQRPRRTCWPGCRMGYNRDTREMKEWSALGFDKTLAALGILHVTLGTLAWTSADAGRRARQLFEHHRPGRPGRPAHGVGYRQMYAIVGKLVDQLIEAGQAPGQPYRARQIVTAAPPRGWRSRVTDKQVRGGAGPRPGAAARGISAARHRTEMAAHAGRERREAPRRTPGLVEETHTAHRRGAAPRQRSDRGTAKGTRERHFFAHMYTLHFMPRTVANCAGPGSKMSEKMAGLLVLADGTVVGGLARGARAWSPASWFSRPGMTGYQEALTDPSYAGQMLIFTYPLLGNYGAGAAADQSRAHPCARRDHARAAAERRPPRDRRRPATPGCARRAFRRWPAWIRAS